MKPTSHSQSSSRIVPSANRSAEPEHHGTTWGFKDSGFALSPNETAVFTGNRYPLCGAELPELWSFVVSELGEELAEPTEDSPTPQPTAPRRTNQTLEAALQTLVGPSNIATDDATRRRRGHGHSLDEVHALRYATLERIPDIVVRPESEEDVVQLVELAKQHDACLIPYGGGTNVTHALKCSRAEQRVIVAVDMGRMNQVLWIDPVDGLAHIQAGAVGRHIASQLTEHGYVLGHEPDSIEFSTLGGWIATNASGMKKNRYGNIEDIVIDLRAVSHDGLIHHHGALPRESIGTDVRRWFFGSEGNLGIITSAVVKISKKPVVEEYASYLFSNFNAGVAFLRALSFNRDLPASVRLVDNTQFRLGQALKPAPTSTARVVGKLQKSYLTRIKGYDLAQVAACTIVYEGSADEVATQKRWVANLAKQHKALPGGADNGKRGYTLTFGIAYLRDFLLRYGVLAESLETSVPWSKVEAVQRAVREDVTQKHRELELPGRAFISSRISQVYDSGVCIYFYIATYGRGLSDPRGSYAQLEHAARSAILANGGSLSHHHGIGKLRASFLPEVVSPAAQSWRRRTKQALDPDSIFAARNQESPDNASSSSVSTDAPGERNPDDGNGVYPG